AVALAPLHFAVEDAAEVLLLLVVVAVNDDGGANHRGAHAADVHRALFGELLVHDELFHHAQAGAAVLLRPGGGYPALGGELLAPFTAHGAHALHHLHGIRVGV